MGTPATEPGENVNLEVTVRHPHTRVGLSPRGELGQLGQRGRTECTLLQERPSSTSAPHTAPLTPHLPTLSGQRVTFPPHLLGLWGDATNLMKMAKVCRDKAGLRKTAKRGALDSPSQGTQQHREPGPDVGTHARAPYRHLS